VNIGFFVMAIVVMRRHQQKSKVAQTRIKLISSWTKGVISLSVIMGLTWIVGLLVVEEVKLTFLIYIFTLLVAFQGLAIFVIFILLSTSVQAEMKKFWKSKVGNRDLLMRHLKIKRPADMVR